ncbi:MAG: DEAD/DEAH box helicase family protein [Syntrophaceae bacterium]|nr:DEAD/DEAH box helicase family protein [Syntrophaceae bacterium]
MARKPKAIKLNLSEHTLDVNVRKCNYELFDFREVEEYVKALTGSRTYQYDAIRRTMIYLWGGGYKNLRQLAAENFKRKQSIQERFFTEENFLRHLPLPDRLSGVIHMATGTGKSWVIFAVAYLSIVMKKAKRVLVLGPPSTIIEAGLREKFKRFMEDATLISKLPPKYRNIPVTIIDETKPAEDCSIMIENINAVYNKDFNAIGDTLFSQTDEVLVLSDEVHHVYSHLTFTETDLLFEGEGGRGEERNERLWMKFLREEPKIKRHVGFTGTPYNQDEYFTDILFNYSIADAQQDQIIKRINPILHTESDEKIRALTQDQAFELIYKTHLDNQQKFAYPKRGKPTVKPITVFIAPKQGAAQKKSEEFIQFLAKEIQTVSPDQGLPASHFETKAREKVLCVLSRLAKADYQKRLDEIERLDEPAEFIFAVNKLSEGWDVDNVFQIVPMQERVFESKLLISQVLGRGLRIPRKASHGDILGNYPIVTVTNHEKFADHIRELVDSVTQCEVYLTSAPLPIDGGFVRAGHHFSLIEMAYTPVTSLEDRTGNGGKISPELTLNFQKEKLGYTVTYQETGDKKFQLRKNFFTADEVAYNQFKRFNLRVFEKRHFQFGETLIDGRIPQAEEIRQVIANALEKAGIASERLSEENARLVDLYFSQYLPVGKKRPRKESRPGNLILQETSKMDRSSTRASELDRDVVVFVSEDYEEELGKENLFVLEYVKAMRGRMDEKQLSLFDKEEPFISKKADLIRCFVGFRSPFIVNTSVFKTPQNLVRLSSHGETLFVFGLLENARYIYAWVKSRDMGFYAIEYEYFRKGKDRTRGSFNPDFFIRIDLDRYIRILREDGIDCTGLSDLQDHGIESIIRVVEIKSDDDDDEATPAKERYAAEHFKALNERLQAGESIPAAATGREEHGIPLYLFDLLTPSRIDQWFELLRQGQGLNRAE